MKTKLILCVMLFLMISLKLNGQQLELKIMTTKTEFILAEPIEIGIVLQNIGKELFRGIRPSLVLGSLKIEIRDIYGIAVPYTGFYGTSMFNDFELKSQDEEYILVSSDENFGYEICKSMSTRFIENGEYTIQAFYLNSDVPLKSNIISIKVNNPTDQELFVYNKFIEITDKIDYSTKEKIAESIADYKVLVEENSNSVYAPLIWFRISTLYLIELENKMEAMRIRRRILEDYPNSAKGQCLIDPVLNEIGDNSEKVKFLQYLKEKSKNSLMEKIITKKLIKSNDGWDGN